MINCNFGVMTNSKDMLDNLNENQRKAVKETEGPVMVIAGAGSGKTRVLTYRVAHLLTNGVDPFRILSLTFTNKAAREMKDRIIQLVGNTDAKNVWMGTFHSIFARVLRSEGEKTGYPSNYTIYDTDDSKSLIRNVLKTLNIDPKNYAPNYILNKISGAKSSLISWHAYQENQDFLIKDKMAGKPRIAEIYERYQKKLFQSAAMDFDDLLFNTYKLFQQYPDTLYKYQRKFEYILVDEYQDTNYAQYILIKQLAANNENICVVGDDAQSIYGFRGANIQNILNFKHDYPDLKTFKLEQNYRSTDTIVKAANSIIVNNKDQIFKEIWTQNESGSKIQLIRSATDGEEGRLVANSIFEIKMNEHLNNKAFAILYRTNAQSRAMEEALRKLNIPYRIYGGLSFYQRKEIKDLLAYFRLVINNQDEEALNRIINYPARGIGKTSLERMTVAAREQEKSIWNIAESIHEQEIGINAGSKRKIADFVHMIKSFSVQLKTHNAYELGKLIATSSGILKELYNDKTPEGISRFENIEELLNAIKEFTDRERTAEELEEGLNTIRNLDEFLQEIALLTDADKNDKDNDRVSLMTIHAAKGLEFPFVYVVGLEENLFPSIQSINSRADLEEERRLFYVAVTRAEKKLHISYAESRYKWGNLIICEPSRFIDEIDPQFIDSPKKSAVPPPEPKGSGFKKLDLYQSGFTNLQKKNLKRHHTLQADSTSGNDFSSNNADEIQVGMQVQHQRFGKGKVLQIEQRGANTKATVFFQTVGQKQLLLKYAKLKILN